ncbi:hypothetical protein RFF05_00335 [Bengtsoniella intestinalis]
MKKYKWLMIFGIAVIVCTVLWSQAHDTQSVMEKFVLEHRDDLEEIALEHLSGESLVGAYGAANIDGVYQGDHQAIVQFLYKATGFAPSAKYYGFYYAQQNEPVAFQNTSVSLTETDSDTWQWSDGTDNGGIYNGPPVKTTSSKFIVNTTTYFAS